MQLKSHASRGIVGVGAPVELHVNATKSNASLIIGIEGRKR
jgi:hypothetical protein